jgi:Cys-rich repeat protein
MKRALALCAVVFAACSTAIKEPPPCASDSDCPSGNICFAEGCGDPGTGIVVEVEGSALTSFRARDFGLADGTLLATYDFQMGEALALTGQLQRELSTGVATDRTSYTEGVVVRAVGTSTLLPGITRTFETRFDKPEFGFFEMNVGAGNFTLIATPIDARVPPVSSTAVVGSAATPSVTFAFPAVDGAPALSGFFRPIRGRAG